MSNNAKKKKGLIAGLAIVIVISISIILLLKFKSSPKMLYGTFEHINDEGVKSIITIDKESVYLENIDYDKCEDLSAMMYILNEKANDDEVDHNHNHESEHDDSTDREELRKQLAMDYKTVYDRKKHSYTVEEVNNEKDYVDFSLLVTSSDEEIYGISIYMNPREKTCFVSMDDETVYRFTGK